jgi:hypothetical protein
VAVASFEFLGALSYEYMYYSISYGSNHTRQKIGQKATKKVLEIWRKILQQKVWVEVF